MIMQFMFNQCNSFREENISVFSQWMIQALESLWFYSTATLYITYIQ
jgi:hypothetical protein